MKILLLIFLAAGVGYTVFLLVFNSLSQHIQILNVDDFEKQLKITKEAQLIDVRTHREFKKQHIAGAKNIDYLRIDFRKEIEKLDKTKPVMVYCHSGYRSKMTLPTFRNAGFTTIYELKSGFSGWVKAGQPIAIALQALFFVITPHIFALEQVGLSLSNSFLIFAL